MEEQWIKVLEIGRMENLVKEKYLIDFAQKRWEEILKQYEIKYKLDIEQGTEYIGDGRRQHSLQKVYILGLYTTKENIEQMKSIIKDVENAQSEIPLELQEIDEEDENENVLSEKISNYFVTILMILLIILEIGMIIYSIHQKTSKEQNMMPLYIVMGIAIIIELYCIKIINQKKKRNKDEQ